MNGLCRDIVALGFPPELQFFLRDISDFRSSNGYVHYLQDITTPENISHAHRFITETIHFMPLVGMQKYYSYAA